LGGADRTVKDDAPSARAALAERAMAGDERAFEDLVADCQASVRALCRRLTRSATDGDDIAQAAFLTAWRRKSTWRGGSFKSWVCVIAYREFLNRKRIDTPVEDAAAMAGAHSETPGERMDLQRAFSVLDPGEREAIALCLGAGLSHTEAAAAMNAPIGTVKSWVLRGRAKLQKALAGYERA
jgi:RNA polymerase sigma-70 factor (ECF subfamily)